MTVWIGLLRAVNVSGANRLPMGEFRAMLAGIGLPEARTYIQSGNVVVRSDLGADALALRIADGIEAEFGFRVPIVMRSLAQLEAAIAANPFAEVLDNLANLHLFFMQSALPEKVKASLETKRAQSERFVLQDDLAYLHAPNGVGRSVLATALSRQTAVLLTARNLRTVIAVADLARGLDERT